MKAPWEYLENINEIVIVININTYEIAYMNRYAREKFKASETDYKAKKCYTLLQGLKAPCLFCQNDSLDAREVDETVCRNPILGESLRIKTVVMEYEGQKFRAVIGLKMKEPECDIEDSFLIYQETMLNECLMLGCFASNEEDLLSGMLEYICVHLECTGCFIYEPGNDGNFHGTYGWFQGERNLPGPLPVEQEMIQELSSWYGMLRHNEPVVLRDMEKVYRKNEEIAEYLKPYDVKSLIVFPLMRDGDMGGLLRIDNPPENKITQIVHFCKLLCHFISATLYRRDMVNTLKQISYYDQLTGAKNRYALSEFTASEKFADRVGILFGDVNGLKHVNDTLGHECGDQLIQGVCQSLMNIFGRNAVYRMGGDEFLVICPGVEREEFEKIVAQTKAVPELMNDLSIGAVWRDRGPKDFMEMVNEADECMYEEKRKFHRNRGEILEY